MKFDKPCDWNLPDPKSLQQWHNDMIDRVRRCHRYHEQKAAGYSLAVIIESAKLSRVYAIKILN
jgi:hypothetical protein